MVCLASCDQVEDTEKKRKKEKAQVTATLRKCDRRRPAQNKVEQKSILNPINAVDGTDVFLASPFSLNMK